MGHRGEHYSFKRCKMEEVLKDIETTLNSFEGIVENIYDIAVIEILKATNGHRKGKKLLYVFAENFILNNHVFLNANGILTDDEYDELYNDDLDFVMNKYWGKMEHEWLDFEKAPEWVKEGRIKFNWYKFKDGKLVLEEE